MSENGEPSPWLGPEFFENRHRYPPEELLKYAGKYVAWSWDGRQIVASADTEEDLVARVKTLGIDWQRVVYSFVPEPDVSYL